METGFGLRDLDGMGVLNKEKTAVRDNCASNVEQFLRTSRVGYARRTILARLETASWCCTSRSFSRIFDLFYERYLKAVEAAKRQGRVAHVLWAWGRRLFTLHNMPTDLRRYDEQGDSHFWTISCQRRLLKMDWDGSCPIIR